MKIGGSWGDRRGRTYDARVPTRAEGGARYTCKNGGLHVVYTWEGCSASLKARTAASLRVANLKVDCGWDP